MLILNYFHIFDFNLYNEIEKFNTFIILLHQFFAIFTPIFLYIFFIYHQVF